MLKYLQNIQRKAEICVKSTGIVRKIDSLGRMVLPSELRAQFGLSVGDSVEIFTNGDMIVLKKYAPADIFTGEMENLIEYRGKKVSVDTIKELARIAGLKVTENDDMYNFFDGEDM